MIDVLYSLLTAAAQVGTEGAAGAFGKGGGKAAFDAIKDRLARKHAVQSLPLLEAAPTNPAYETAVKADLAKPGISQDADLMALAETLRQAIEALPVETQARYAIDITTIRAGRDVLVENAEGVRVGTVDAGQDATFRNVTAPPGKR